MMPIGGHPSKYQAEFEEEEKLRQKRLHTRVIKKAMDNLRRALRMEITKKELSDEHKDRFIMTPLDFISRSYVKLSIVGLYRRYRQIRIQALTECLAIVGQGNTKKENLEAIRNKINAFKKTDV